MNKNIKNKKATKRLPKYDLGQVESTDPNIQRQFGALENRLLNKRSDDGKYDLGYLKTPLSSVGVSATQKIKPMAGEVDRMTTPTTSKPGINGMTTAGGVANIISGASSLLKSEDETSTGNYVSNIAGSAASGASMGAALGPYGMAAGAAIGGAVGLFQQNKMAAAQRLVEKKEDINKVVTQNNSTNANIGAQYNMSNQENTRVPGLNKGIAKFKSGTASTNEPNAMVASEEGVMDGITGRVSTVPGTYDPNNPDTTTANLTNGSSVFSKRQSQTIPGGNSTPADIIARAAQMQKTNDKILNPKAGERKLSTIDQNTAKLNQANIQKQADNLNKFNMLINPQIQQVNDTNLPKYAGGVVESKDPATEKNLAALNGKLLNGERAADIDASSLSDEDSITINVPLKRGHTLAREIPKYLDVAAGKKWNKVYHTGVLGNGSLSKAMAGHATVEAQKTDKRSTIGGSRGHRPDTYPVTFTKAQLNEFEEGYVKPTGATAITTTNTVAVPPTVAPPLATTATGQPTTVAKAPKQAYDPFGKLSTIGNTLASLAPIAYNNRNKTPEVASPVYSDFINPNERYNIAPQVADALKQRQIARYNNASINTNTGANMAYGADLYSRGTEQLSGIMDTAEDANITYRSRYADRYNQNAGQQANEIRRVDDLNARNRASGRNFGAKNAEMISQYAQNQQLMSNQKKASLLNSGVWSAYATAMEKGQREKMMQLIEQYNR